MYLRKILPFTRAIVPENLTGLMADISTADAKNAVMDKTIARIADAGILAADESTGTMNKRLASIGVDQTEENGQRWRDLMFTTVGLCESGITGVILFDETARQEFLSDGDSKTYIQGLKQDGIIPGIKVDRSLQPMIGGLPGEQQTKDAISDLPARLTAYAQMGLLFAKWREVIHIAEGTDPSDKRPSDQATLLSAVNLARYARACQDAGIVPIVEPEVLINGTHGIKEAQDVETRVLTEVFTQLRLFGVDLKRVILKPSMVIDGAENRKTASKESPENIAAYTLACFEASVPKEVPLIAFLSGGQSPTESIENLAAINRLADAKNKEAAAAGKDNPDPWRLTYSYGRGLQKEPLEAWQGEDDNISAAQAELRKQAAACYSGSMAKAPKIASSLVA